MLPLSPAHSFPLQYPLQQSTLRDTILTPFSFSPSCDSVVDLLPELFLAYCTIHDMAVRYKSPVSDIHAQPVPDPYDSDPAPLFTD